MMAWGWDDLGPAPSSATPAAPSAPRAQRPRVPRPETRGWVWPVPIFDGHAPEISSGFGPRGDHEHLGVDVMFRRASTDDYADHYPPRTRHGSPSGRWFMPDQIPALAAGPGRVVFASRTPKGHTVVIDHGPIRTYYTHLQTLFVDEVDGWNGRQLVEAGRPLGIIGGNPEEGRRALMHLHFEAWQGRGRRAVDPRPMMAGWRYLTMQNALAAAAPWGFA